MAKKKSGSKLWLGMGIYALVFLAVVAVGLIWFWSFMAAYEHSRVQSTMDSYVAALDTQTLIEKAAETMEVDSSLQSIEDCRDFIAGDFASGITYARKLSECTDSRTVYMLMAGKRTIGKVTLTAGQKDSFGFTPWTVTEESFDFSYLAKDITTVELTVPHDYTVTVNGKLLGSTNIVNENVPYTPLTGFGSDYKMPHLVSYASGNLLGNPPVVVTDAQGNVVTLEDIPTADTPPNNCTQDEIDAITAVAEPFTKYYVDFTSYKDHNSNRNVKRLAEYMVPDGALEKRMYDAIESLSWIVDRKSQITERTYHHYVKLEDGRYLCDMTYHVNTSDFAGATTATNNVKLILVNTDKGLKVEAMTSY